MAWESSGAVCGVMQVGFIPWAPFYGVGIMLWGGVALLELSFTGVALLEQR